MDLSDFPALIGAFAFGPAAGILIVGASFVATAALANYFILLPLFEQFMPVDQLIASFGEFIPFTPIS